MQEEDTSQFYIKVAILLALVKCNTISNWQRTISPVSSRFTLARSLSYF